MRAIDTVEYALRRHGTPLAYVTQTTLSVDDTRDICYATQNRQTAVRELSRQVDVVLVVGTQNGSNSQRLREIAAQAGAVGVAASASAPEVTVQDVELSTMPGREEHMVFSLPAELAPDTAVEVAASWSRRSRAACRGRCASVRGESAATRRWPCRP